MEAQRMDPETLRRWMQRLATRDPDLHAELSQKVEERVRPASNAPAGLDVLEAVARPENAAPAALDMTYETIVREGRPALLVKDDRISPEDAQADALSKTVIERLFAAAPKVEPAIPLVGRIDVANHPRNFTYVGTGWLIEPDIVVTNRHVADLIARRDGTEWRFRPGVLGDPLVVSVDYRRELGGAAADSVAVERIIWIEPDERKADIAFLKVARRSDGSRQDRIPLAGRDASPGDDVAVIGYPARAPASILPDQAWMERIYRGAYDVKRIAPGLMDDNSRGWATHDCTTLGGNSGSVVLDMRTGQAVALHFAGLFMVENFAVPASSIRRYLRERPWEGGGGWMPVRPRAKPKEAVGTGSPVRLPPPPTTQAAAAATAGHGSVTFTVPLSISVSLGGPAPSAPLRPGAPAVAGGGAARPPLGGDTRPAEDDSGALARAAGDLRRELGDGAGVLAVRPGYSVEEGRLSDRVCLVVAADPVGFEAVRQRAPARFAGLPVEVRPATLADQLRAAAGAVEEAAVASVAYDDENRRGEPFSFDWVDEEMAVTCHVGPERSWEVLSEFLAGTEKDLVSSIYEFHATHIADAVEKELGEGARMTLVLARQSRDPASGRQHPGDFDRGETFGRWEDGFGRRFERVVVPTGSNGLVATAYHIKVTVRDGAAFWLSSGNWKRTSQPVIAGADRDDPAVAARAGNREWHIVVENGTLAQRFQNHIKADYERSKELGGTLEAAVAAEDDVWVDVPEAVSAEAVAAEAPPAEVMEPLRVRRRLRVKPLLTPDRAGAVYGDAVLDLIRGARRQLVLQNQYISIAGAADGRLSELVDAVVEASERVDDLRIVLRSEGDGFWEDVSALKGRGLDVARCIRRVPKTHTKGIVADGTRVLIGSHNWSSLGVTLNRDASLLIDDPEVAGYYLRAFEIDWDRARPIGDAEAPFAPEAAPRLAVGPEPPAGFRRERLSDFLDD